MGENLTGLPPGFVLDQPTPGDLPPGFVLDADPVVDPEAPDEDVPLLSRIETNIDKRLQQKDEIVRQFREGKISRASGVFQLIGNVGAATVSEAIGEAVASGIDVGGDVLSAITPDVIEQPIKEFAASGLKTILDSDLGKAGIAAAEQGLEFWEDFKEENPQAAGNIEAFVNIGGLIGPGKLIKIGKTTKIGKLTKEQLDNAPKAADIRAASSKQFQGAKQSGASLRQDTYLDFLADAEKDLVEEGLDSVIHPKLTRIFNGLSKKLGEDLNAKDLFSIRQRIGVAVDSLEPDEARLARRLRDNFDDTIEGLPGNETWKKARATYARFKRTEMIEEAIERAGLSASGVEAGLRNEFRSILKSKKKSRGFSVEEKAAMKAVVDGDFTTNILKKIGKFGVGGGTLGALLGGGAGVAIGGGPGGAAALIGTDIAARLASRRTVNAAEVLRALAAGEKPALIPKTTLSLKNFIAAEAATGLISAEVDENE